MNSSWTRASLSEVAAVIGRGIAPKYSEDGATIVLNQRCIREGRVNESASRNHDSEARPVKAEKLLRVGDVLVNSTGVGTLGRTAPVRGLSQSTTVDSHITIVRPNLDTDPQWLAYALAAAESRIEGMAEGSTGQTELSRHQLSLMEIGVPPLSVQRAIAATLGALDDKIDSNRRAQDLAEQLVRAHFELLFKVSPVLEGVAISDLIEINPRRSLGKNVAATYVGMSSLPEFSAEVYNWETRQFGSGQKFVNGDVLMARITPCLENGKTAVVDMLDASEVGWGSTEYIVLSPKGLFSTPWIYCLVRHDDVRGFAIRGMTGTSGRQRFQARSFDDYRIPQPGESALEAFNELSLPLFARMTQLRDQNRRLIELRDVLLPALLSGRVRVGESERVPT